MRLARRRFSALQRAEIAEIDIVDVDRTDDWGFSALQRAEIAEMRCSQHVARPARPRFSALQRAEIAEMYKKARLSRYNEKFQCSSTSRNC